MSRGCYNWAMTTQLEPRKDSKSPSRINNFTGRVRGMPIFVRNSTNVSDFMIVEDIRVVNLTKGVKEIAYKIPHKIEQYNSLSNEEKENMKLVYLRNEEDKRKRVEYVMSKILGFYKECLELGPEYQTGLEKNSSEVVKTKEESRKESDSDEDEEYAMAVKEFKEILQENEEDLCVTQIISLENVQSRQRTPIKEHSLEEYGATMEKMRWKRLKMKLAL
ncbi:hypothetical protein Tco_1439283 [Tanacetum coccineum]